MVFGVLFAVWVVKRLVELGVPFPYHVRLYHSAPQSLVSLVAISLDTKHHPQTLLENGVFVQILVMKVQA